MEWTSNALQSALKTIDEICSVELSEATIRRALNAAVRAQGIDLVKIYNSARAEALEEAAKAARDCAIFDANDRLLNSDIRATCSAAIRALKNKPANQTDGGE